MAYDLSPQQKDFLSDLGLRYVRDDAKGFSRKRKGKGFIYLDLSGKRITDPSVITRIQSLVIPPAWEDVWICRLTNGHLQVTGRDQRKRKQYKYHSKWATARNETKFENLQNMGNYLKILRPQVEKDLSLREYCRQKVLAAVIKIIEETNIRVGNDEYAASNKSYGLTTLLNDHVDVRGSKIEFHFRGKSGVEHKSNLVDSRLSRIIKKCQELPGEELFTYVDGNGNPQDVSSHHVNRYLRETVGAPLTAKDFRTWGASRRAVQLLLEKSAPKSPTKTELKKFECEMIKEAASTLGNTVAVCRKYYVHPNVFKAFAEGRLHKIAAKTKKGEPWLTREEKILLEIL